MDAAKLHEFAEWLNEQPSEERRDLIYALPGMTNFCWYCGYPNPSSGYCQCQNDE